MKQLVMMVGIAGSGKSTIANKIAAANHGQVLAADKIREELYGDEAIQGNPKEVFEILHERIQNALTEEEGFVVYDATNINKHKRTAYLRTVPKDVQKICVFVNNSLEKALLQNSRRSRHVPEDVIRHQYSHLNEPTPEEGWDMIYVL